MMISPLPWSVMNSPSISFSIFTNWYTVVADCGFSYNHLCLVTFVSDDIRWHQMTLGWHEDNMRMTLECREGVRLSRGEETAGSEERLEGWVSQWGERQRGGQTVSSSHLTSHHVRGLSGNLLLCRQGWGFQQTESPLLLRRGEGVLTRDLSVTVIIAGGHREAEHEGGGGGPDGPGGGGERWWHDISVNSKQGLTRCSSCSWLRCWSSSSVSLLCEFSNIS